uniref:Mobile element protein n=1 Tax=Colwellia sp. C1 TaxID=1737566 RepID=A0A0P0LXP7_9GAMM|nr:Mobile element protein [Colwellia sp. C1]
MGVGVNADYLAVTVVNKQGNKVFTTDIPCPISGKMDSSKRAVFIGDAVKEVVEISTQYQVGISHESLDFQRNKRVLKETTGKQHRRLLSTFAYNSVLSFLTRRAYRQGVLSKSVNPVCSSIIGGLKYQNNSLTSHQSAAMVIARRGLGIWFERIRLNVPSKIGFAILNA